MSTAAPSGAMRSSGTGRMRLMPSTIFVSCSEVSANAALLAPTMVAGVAQRFSMRPKPAIIAIPSSSIPAGGSRTQPSRTRGEHSRAHAVSDAPHSSASSK